MRDENFCTLGGRVTHQPGLYPTKSDGWILAFSIANHAMGKGKDEQPLYIDVKIPGNDKAKLEEFVKLLPKGRKVTVYHAQLQIKQWLDGDVPKKSYQLFSRLDNVFLRDLPRNAQPATLPAA